MKQKKTWNNSVPPFRNIQFNPEPYRTHDSPVSRLTNLLTTQENHCFVAYSNSFHAEERQLRFNPVRRRTRVFGVFRYNKSREVRTSSCWAPSSCAQWLVNFRLIYLRRTAVCAERCRSDLRTFLRINPLEELRARQRCSPKGRSLRQEKAI